MGKTRGHRGSQHTYKKHQASKASMKWAKEEVHREARTQMRSDIAHAERTNTRQEVFDVPATRVLVNS